MKTISLICAAAALCVPALAAAQRGGGSGAVATARGAEIQRFERIDRGPAPSFRGDVVVTRGEVVTGTRIRHPNPHARRRWNAANPPDPDPSRRRAGD